MDRGFFFRRAAAGGFEKLLNERFARPAARSGSRCFAKSFEALASGFNGREDAALGHAVAVAHLKRIGRIRDAGLDGLSGEREEQSSRIFRNRLAPMIGLEQK